MVYKLLKFYDENYNVLRLFLKELKCKRMLQVKILITITSLMAIVIKCILIKKAILFILALIPFYVGLIIFFLETCNILNKKHGIPLKGRMVNISKFGEKRKKDIREFLIKNEINTVERLKYFIELLEETTREAKSPNLFNKGLVVGIIAPVWVQFVIWFFKNVKSYSDALAFIGITLAFMVIFVVIYESARQFIEDEIINSDYNKFKLLLSIVKDIYLFELNSDKNKLNINKEIALSRSK